MLSVMFVLILGTAFGLGMMPVTQAVNAEAEWAAVDISESYPINSEFTIPEREVTVNGETVRVSGVLVYPDGTATLMSPSVLDQTGTYSVRWSAEVGGKPYAEESTFVIYNPLLSHGVDTTVEYGTPHTGKTPGMLVHLAQNDTLTFMQYIDVSDLTQDNFFAEFYVYPTTSGVADIDAIVFTLTDAENPDIYVKIRGHRYIRCPGLVYYSAGFNGGPMKGYEASRDKVQVDNEWGMPMGGSFEAMRYDWGTGISSYEDSDRYIQKLGFDWQNMGVYGDCGTPSYSGQIIDLDSASYFDTLFGGFPSGKVFLSVSAEGFNSSSANICFTKVLGTEVTDYDGSISDNDPPEITVESPYETMPEARIGGSYPIMQASAQDVYSGACEVKVSVWYNYMTSEPVRVAVTDGKFETAKAGWYAIVYESQDQFGNSASKILWVHAGNTIEEMQFTLGADAIASEAELGSWVAVPAATPSLVTGGSGSISVSVAVTHEGETTAVKDGFRPELSGEWVVEYTAIDITGTEKTISFVVNARPGDAPLLTEDPVVPQIFISDVPYTLAKAYATDYSSGAPERILLDVKVEDANGTKSYKSGEKFTPTVENNGDTIRLTYLCNGVTVKEYTVPVILAFSDEDGTTRLSVENYFYGEGISNEKTLTGIILFAESGRSEIQWTYANALAAELSLVLESVPGYSSFESLVFTLTDSQDSSACVSATLRNDATGAVFMAGGSSVSLEQSFRASSAQRFTIGFSGTEFSVNGVRMPVTSTQDGEPFSGFSSGMVYLKVEMNGIGGAAAHKVVSVNDYPFTESTRDLVSPKIVILSDYGGCFSSGDTYTIGRAVAADVLSPAVTFGLTVRDPEGNIVSDVNGVRLENVDPGIEYTIRLELFGQYKVSYTAAEDSVFIPRPNSVSLGYALNVEDSVPPEIKMEGSLVQTAKVGEVITLPAYTVTDNETAQSEIIVNAYVLNPNGSLIMLSGNSFKPSYAGVYEFRITAMDADGNLSMIRLYVTVSAAE